jgi:broad-specificity NMP kinase
LNVHSHHDRLLYICLQELARSTLLRALQLERNNVDELESVVASLQQNNSAIAEMVKSRDTIIDELNSRVAVFEEDKVVLKAALKQLQKEMKEEAPRTEKLIDDLEAARKGMYMYSL